MPSPKATDQEFLAAWEKYRSIAQVARVLGIQVRACAYRRRKLEQKYQVRLTSVNKVGSARDLPYIVDSRAEVKVEIEDGVVMVGGDAHYWPGWVPTMHRAFIELAKRFRPKLMINNGDSFDGSTISRHADIGHETRPSVSDEVNVNKDRLGELVAASPGSKRIWHLGNHCMRFETYLAERVPEYQRVQGFHLKDHFPSWIPAWFTTINNGQASHTEIRHRERGGIHASYNNVLHSGVNIVTGHDHVADCKRFDDRRGFRWAVRTGMLADDARDPPFLNYLEGRKPNWQSAFVVLFYRSGRLLQPQHCWRIDEDTVEFMGEIIKV